MRHGAFRIEGETASREYEGFMFIDGTQITSKTETFKRDDLEAVMRGEDRKLPEPPRRKR